MAQSIVEKISILFDLDSKPLEKGAKQVETHLGFLTRQIETLGQSFLVGGGIAAGAGAFNAIAGAAQNAAGAIVDLALNSFEIADNFDSLAKRSDLTADALQEMQYVATKTDSDFEGMAAAVGKMGLAIQEAGEKGGDSAQAFADLGLDLDELIRMKPEDSFYAIVKALGSLDNSYKQNSVSSAIFSKSYKDLKGIVKEGADGIDYYRERFAQLGGTADLSGLLRAQESFDDIHHIIQRVSLELGAGIAPAMTVFADQIIDAEVNAAGLDGSFGGLTASVVEASAQMADFKDNTLGLLNAFRRTAQGARIEWQQLTVNMQEFWDNVGGLPEEDPGLTKMKEDLEDLKREYLGISDTVGTGDQIREQFKKNLDDARNKREANDEQGDPDVVSEERTKATAKAKKDLDDFINSMELEFEANQKHLTQEERKLEALKKSKDMDKARIEDAELWVDILKNQQKETEKLKKIEEERKAQQEELQAFRDDVMNTNRTKEEKMLQEQYKIDSLLANGKITVDQAEKFERKKREEIYGKSEVRFAGAAEFGSEAAREIILSMNKKSEEQIAKEQVKEQKRANDILNEINRNQKNRKQVVIA
jgi:hypothetical protein